MVPSKAGTCLHKPWAPAAGLGHVLSWFGQGSTLFQNYLIGDVVHIPPPHSSGGTLRFVYSIQKRFFDGVLISAPILTGLISSSGIPIILRLNSEVFCVSHFYLSSHFNLSPFIFGGPYQFILQVTDSVFSSVDFHSLLLASKGQVDWFYYYIFSFLSTLSYCFTSFIFFSTCFSLQTFFLANWALFKKLFLEPL